MRTQGGHLISATAAGGGGSGGLQRPGGAHELTDPAPRSLVQALLTVLSQVLCFLAVKAYLPLLVCSLVLGWLNLLYYTRGLQHTGIYSVMIQKVRGRGSPVQPDWAEMDTAPQGTPFGLSRQAQNHPPRPAPGRLGRGEREQVCPCPVPPDARRVSASGHTYLCLLSGSALHMGKHTCTHVCWQVSTQEHVPPLR